VSKRKEKLRPFVELNEFLTGQELALSDFKDIDFEEQMTAIIELLTQKKPKAKEIEGFLSEDTVDSSSEHWPMIDQSDEEIKEVLSDDAVDPSSEPWPQWHQIRDWRIDQCLTSSKVLNDSLLNSSRHEFKAIWRELDTTNTLQQLWLAAAGIDVDRESTTNLFFSMRSLDLRPLSLKPFEFRSFKGDSLKLIFDEGGKYRDCLEKIAPPAVVENAKFITVTLLIPAVHEKGKEVIESKSKWTFHHTEISNKKSLALRLFTVFECIGIVTNSKTGIWPDLIKKLKLPVTQKKSDKGNWQTLFEQEGLGLYPLFKGMYSEEQKKKRRFLDISHTMSVISEDSETKPANYRHSLLNGLNELMMFTSGTAFSIKVPVATSNEGYQGPIIIAPSIWKKALSRAAVTNLPEKDGAYSKDLPPVHSYLFKEDYNPASSWLRFHLGPKYFTDKEKTDLDVMKKFVSEPKFLSKITFVSKTKPKFNLKPEPIRRYKSFAYYLRDKKYDEDERIPKSIRTTFKRLLNTMPKKTL
jgi:hypothetical protein